MTCARCLHFTLKAATSEPADIAAAAARTAAGWGHCVGFLASVNSFVEWEDPRCGGFRPAKQMAARLAWMSVRTEMEQGQTGLNTLKNDENGEKQDE